MKRYAVILAGCLFSSNLLASGIELSLGLNAWQTEVQGTYGEASDAMIDFSNKEHSVSEFYIVIEHPFPLLPNLRYLNRDFSDQTSLTLPRTFVLGEQVYAVASQIKTDYQQELTDVTWYYEVFDNQVLEFDLGLTYRSSDAMVWAQNLDDLTQDSTTSDEHSNTMVFGAAAVNLPLLNLTLASELNYRNSDNYDSQLFIDYELAMVPLISPYVRFGVKYHKSDFTFDQRLTTQYDWNTLFVGIGLGF